MTSLHRQGVSRRVTALFGVVAPVFSFLGAASTACGVNAVRPGFDGDPGVDAGTGASCVRDSDCLPTEFCGKLATQCGQDDNRGLCLELKCEADSTRPICGCDGVLYDDMCSLRKAGQVAGSGGSACTAPEGMFRCGVGYCFRDREMCSVGLARHCNPLPDACRIADAGCDCFEPTPPSPVCGCKKDDHFEVQCAE